MLFLSLSPLISLQSTAVSHLGLVHTEHKNETSHNIKQNTAGHNWFPTERFFIQKVRCFASKDTWYEKGREEGPYLVKTEINARWT